MRDGRGFHRRPLEILNGSPSGGLADLRTSFRTKATPVLGFEGGKKRKNLRI